MYCDENLHIDFARCFDLISKSQAFVAVPLFDNHTKIVQFYLHSFSTSMPNAKLHNLVNYCLICLKFYRMTEKWWRNILVIFVQSMLDYVMLCNHVCVYLML